MEKLVEIDIHHTESHNNHQYRLFVNNELMVERPYTLPQGWHYQTFKCIIELEQENVVNFEVLDGHLQMGDIRIDNETVKHTDGYFKL